MSSSATVCPRSALSRFAPTRFAPLKSAPERSSLGSIVQPLTSTTTTLRAGHQVRLNGLVEDHRSERDRDSSSSWHTLTSTTLRRIALPFCNGMVPFIPGFAGQDSQTSLRQVDGYTSTGPGVFKLHLDVRSKTEGCNHRTEAGFAINMGRYSFTGFVLVDDRLIKWLEWFNRLKTVV